MKNYSLLILLAALFFPQAAFAQNFEQEEEFVKAEPRYGAFNHVGVGVGAGLDGITGQVAFPIGPNVQLRAGANFSIPFMSMHSTFDFGTYEINGTPRDFDGTDITLSASMQTFNAMLDLYPSKKGGFHFTVGLYGSADFFGNNKILSVKADAREPRLLESEYNSAFIELEDGNEKSRVCSDEEGFIEARLVTKSKIRPYVGIGFGRGVNIRKRVSVSFDLGVMKTDGLNLAATNIYGDDYFLTSEAVDHEDSINGIGDDLIDKLADFGWYPVLRIGLNVRIF